MHDDDLLKGWKEIAACLHTTDRTAQRWESTLGLPVHRIETSRSAVVFASRQELENWARASNGRTAALQLSTVAPELSNRLALVERAPRRAARRAGGRAKRSLTWALALGMGAAALLGMRPF